MSDTFYDRGPETIDPKPYLEVLEQRWTHIPGLLPKEMADRYYQAAQTLPFEYVSPHYLRARQQFERFGLRLDEPFGQEYVWLAELGERATTLVHAGSFVDSAFLDFEPLEAAVQQYDQNGTLSGHRDLVSNPIAIVIFSLGDEAYLDMLEDDRQTIITTVTLRHGDAVVLGAKGLGNGERPMHALRVPEGADTTYSRISVTYRGLVEPRQDLGYAYGS